MTAHPRGDGTAAARPPRTAGDEAGATVAALLARSRRLGADPRNTNYAGGNTSAKATATDPVTGAPVELLWVKGSGGDLGTLAAEGLAVLRLDRLRALPGVYRGPEHEDEMQGLLDWCAHGPGGAAPSIDTAMHGLLDAAHADHLHPDAVIAFAAAADGEALTRDCFGDEVAWVPWRRPGFQLGLDIARLARERPGTIGCVLGGHGLTTWGPTSAACEARSLDVIRRAQAYLDAKGKPDPFGPVRPGYEALPEPERSARAAALAPVVRGLANTDRPVVGHLTATGAVLDFLAREAAPRLVALGTSCPDHFLRTKVRPLLLDLPAAAPLDQVTARLAELHAAYREDYRAYHRRHATADSPPLRGADPAVVLVPGVGMWSFGADAQTARVAGEFYRNAINVMRGAEAVSTYAPITEAEKFRIEYWALEEAKLARRPRPKPLAGKVALVTGAASGIGRAVARKLAALDACVVAADLDAEGAEAVAAELRDRHGADRAVATGVDVTDEAAVEAATRAAVLRYGGVDVLVSSAGIASSAPLTETTLADWERSFAVLARGYFLVARAAFGVMRAQGTGGSMIFIASKNGLVAGKNASAYSAAKAAELHLARCLAEEGGPHGIRVNTVNPDAVLAGSSIWSGSWRAERAAAYGIEPDELEEHYRRRTVLGVTVSPEDVAEAVAWFAGPAASRSTGNILNVDGGVTAAYPR